MRKIKIVCDKCGKEIKDINYAVGKDYELRIQVDLCNECAILFRNWLNDKGDK